MRAALSEPFPETGYAANPMHQSSRHQSGRGDGTCVHRSSQSVGGAVSPLLSNIYLNEVDRMLERAKEATRYGKYTAIEYARFADGLVILVDAHPRHDWLLPAVECRLWEELAALGVEVNEEKSRIVDLSRGECFLPLHP